MNILFLTLSKMEDINQGGIYTDFVRELSNREHKVYVVSPREKREKLPTELVTQGNLHLLKVKMGNITQTKSIVEKGISTLNIERNYMTNIKKYFKGTTFDMIIYSTPPITFNKIIQYFKKKDNSITYLMLKDIFPQNAVDIGLMNKNSFIYKYFRKKEKQLYSNSDIIGCMSDGNLSYITEHNLLKKDTILEVFPNAIKPIDTMLIQKKNYNIREKYGIPSDATIFIYGGNLGKPQGINFLLDIIAKFSTIKNGYLLIIGNGTEYSRINTFIQDIMPNNVSLYGKLPKEEYDELLKISDVGLIFLDNRFTIPNFPSRLTAYMEYMLPIIAATDSHTDLKEVLHDSGAGLWVESGNLDLFFTHVTKLIDNKELRNEMGSKGRNYLERHYDITKTIDILLKHLDGDEKNV